MIHFLDRTFCSCRPCTCTGIRKWTPELESQQKKTGLPVAWGYFCNIKEIGCADSQGWSR